MFKSSALVAILSQMLLANTPSNFFEIHSYINHLYLFTSFKRFLSSRLSTRVLYALVFCPV